MVASIGDDHLWVDEIAVSSKSRYKIANFKIAIEICYQVTGKGFKRFSIDKQVLLQMALSLTKAINSSKLLHTSSGSGSVIPCSASARLYISSIVCF